jgi:uncharacterized hydrophobic protein (TIGR00271 family)
METKFNFNDGSNDDLKKNASGLFRSIVILFKRVFLFQNEVDKNLVVNSIKSDISMRGTTAWILVCSILIASVGLNANSTPVVIGAMLISPLMGPILGLGYSISTNDMQTLKSSVTNFLVMVVISVITAFIFFSLFPLREESSELLARTRPDIRDVLIAFFGGLALIIAKTKKENLSSAIFGVAIATALMPPLCTAGFGLAVQNIDYALGAMYLFSINSIYIIIATYLVLKFLRFPLVNFTNAIKRKKINRYISFTALLIMIPAIITFINVMSESKFNFQGKEFISKELKGLSNYDYLKSVTTYNYNKGDSEIVINNYGQKNISDDFIDVLNSKKMDYSALKDVNLIINQGSNNSNTFVKELRLRDSIELANKSDEVNKLNLEIEALKNLSKEKLIFEKISNEVNLIYPDLKEFEIYEKLGTNFNSTSKDLVVRVKWDTLLNTLEKNKLNISLKRWLEFQFDNRSFILEN